MPDATVPRRPWPLAIGAAAAAVFAALAAGVAGGITFAFDAPLMWALHAQAGPVLDRAAWWLARLGYGWGVLPFDALLVAGLLLRRRLRDAAFAMSAVVGSLALNAALKHLFERARPALWLQPDRPHTWSFPSGHAMADATLAAVLACLCWHTRWRWPVLVLATGFTVLVGLDRMYLGVHYPSDVLAGWAAGVAVAMGAHAAFARGGRR